MKFNIKIEDNEMECRIIYHSKKGQVDLIFDNFDEAVDFAEEFFIAVNKKFAEKFQDLAEEFAGQIEEIRK